MEDRYRTETGEEMAWRRLDECEPRTVCQNSLATYDEATGCYNLSVFGETFRVDPPRRTIDNLTNPSRPYEYLLGLSIPSYLAGALPIPPSGELVKELAGGGFFFRGSHTLPVKEIADMYRTDCAGFMAACGKELGGRAAKIGDCGCRFSVFPRVSMTFSLWLEDSEFPARAALLFDSNADRHMALDVVWAVALVACQRLLGFKIERPVENT